MIIVDFIINDGCIKISLCFLKYNDIFFFYWLVKIYDIVLSLDVFYDK